MAIVPTMIALADAMLPHLPALLGRSIVGKPDSVFIFRNPTLCMVPVMEGWRSAKEGIFAFKIMFAERDRAMGECVHKLRLPRIWVLPVTIRCRAVCDTRRSDSLSAIVGEGESWSVTEESKDASSVSSRY